MSTTAEGSVGVALALVVFAGLSTVLGAAVVFTPNLAKYATPQFLAGGLAFSAGVMTYISFVEIFPKSVSSFAEAGHKEKYAYAFSTLCFQGGVVITIVSQTRSLCVLKFLAQECVGLTKNWNQ